jgi:hypothetical protein
MGFAMSRSEKLYLRLERLEAEYRRLVGHEIRKHLKAWSSVLWNLLHPRIFAGKSWSDDKTMHIQWLSKEIDAFREKLGEPIESSPVWDFRMLARKSRGIETSAMHPLLKQTIERWEQTGASI